MRTIARDIGKTLLVWAALTIGMIAGALVAALPQGKAIVDGPFTSGQALLLANALLALTIAVLAPRIAGRIWQRALTLFVLLYCVETLLSVIEALYFQRYLGLPAGLLGGLAVINVVKSALAAGAAAWLWRAPEAPQRHPRGLAWKLPVLALAYVGFYFGAGEFIAFQSEIVRAYYGNALEIDRFNLALLQIGRGAIWAGLAWLLARTLVGSLTARMLLTGLAFSLFMIVPLLFPSEFMPWSVRSVHMIEIGVSNLLYGLFAGWLLGSGMDSKARAS
ncbi:hypothetical protein [Sphingosinicella sp. BN140058]|uniref:hypothetical protein n=1 Tax=Sphingosinicella sp. BN140058 TaxID=1892855 RepID=UPI001012B471|nr:hypothetical protein [Sphingosinicella sp. BN140058]QAY77312.1 hypothetical protein ETR14_12970 [Sphingosinicella sp. BN140058]